MQPCGAVGAHSLMLAMLDAALALLGLRGPFLLEVLAPFRLEMLPPFRLD